jgi:hypothetical protein
MTLKIKQQIHKTTNRTVSLRSFYTRKKIINRVQRQFTEWEQMFRNHKSDKEFNIQNVEGTPISQMEK